MNKKTGKKIIIAMSPKQCPRHATGQAGGDKKNTRVVVAMSGGVDSSVAAALLKKQNYDVVGVFMKFWIGPRGGPTRINTDNNADLYRYRQENKCCSSDAEKRARAVAVKLKIPFYVFNFEKEFKKKVVDYFIKEYSSGNTPNPCVVCNKEIKFGLLLEKALKLGADFVAAGHYARIKESRIPPKARLAKGGKDQELVYKLLKGEDKNKDQSYFLWQLSQKQLRKILFPVGNYTKKEVRNLARKFKLSTAETLESQEVCFVNKNIEDFLKKYIKQKKGKIVGIKDKVIGEHNSLFLYTIGQRKGIGLPGGSAFVPLSGTTAPLSGATAGKPYYVLNKNIKNNILTVTQNERDLYKKELSVKNVNWISGKEPKMPLKIAVKIRYRSETTPAVMRKTHNGSYKLQLNKPQRAIASGQSAVFYKGEELLGGGIIT